MDLKLHLLLPDFDPEKHAHGDIVGDACAWMATADLCMAENKLEGAALMTALSKAFKSQEALNWLSQVAFPYMTWSDFKVLFLSRYVRQDTTASFLINLSNQRPKEGESLISYAGMLLATFENRWKYMNKKQLALASVLAHISQFAGPEVKQLALTKEIRTKTELQKALKEITNKRTLNDNEGPEAKRRKITLESSICYKCNKPGHDAAQCILISNVTATQTSSTAAQLNCAEMPRNTDMTIGQPGTSKENVDLIRFIDLTEVSRPPGNPMHIGANFSAVQHDIVNLCGTSAQHGNVINFDAEVPVTTTEINCASTVPENTSEVMKTDVPGELYKSLVDLEMLQLSIPNSEPFQCPVCTEDCEVGAGVVLRDCAHHFCKECLSFAVRHCTESLVGCLATGCTGSVEEREIRSLTTPEEYESWLARGLAVVERSSKQAFHCRMRDCKGWAFCEAAVQSFHCPVCQHVSCVPCKEIHEGETCEQHKLRKKQDRTQQKSAVYLNKMVAKGKAMNCPECGITITKVDGCDAITCSACKTQICWATRGRRWGPGGAGDISGGCRCKVNRKRCHPSCKNCH